MKWKKIADWGKSKAPVVRLADRLGRGRGRMRILDHVCSPAKPLKPDLSNWDNAELAAVWIGHATVLLRIGGKTVLTDPVFSNRVGIGFGLITGGPHRLVAPALAIRELPPIDVVLVSHAHFDHLDRPSLDRLDKSTPVIAARHNADLIRDLGFQRVTELHWDEWLQLGSLKITACEVRHWGARAFRDTHRSFNAYLLESSEHRVLYGGDTAYGDHFDDLGKVDLAVLGIGGYDPYVAAHATPEQAVAMADRVAADHILPMHHSTFRLSHEPVHEPIERFLDVGNAAERTVIRAVGEQWEI